MKFMYIIILAVLSQLNSSVDPESFLETSTVTIEYGRGSECIGRGICKIEDATYEVSNRLAILTYDAPYNKIVKLDIPMSSLTRKEMQEQFSERTITIDRKLVYKKKGSLNTTSIIPGKYKVVKSEYGYSIVFQD